ncbi:MAG: bifunctional 2-C-methyl-D-erythritol 4-phosphate cytidylyltransferase/2-C-methyl-D-erythritol 2,4-cyclodiphosphate synthase [Hyphomicrobiaceae bacterium]|nr:bifunctional 2-C-methyl-D-erythritol 4-phosphate cytidylyltransferase/2-C-methyl-D-erythritol 2,4-cyclodiphosphate synthase [Hyphomicrobiaceae bacterium]
MKTAAIIVAAGSGTRAALNAGLPKQYARLGGCSVLAHSLRTFCDHPGVDLVLAVINLEHQAFFDLARQEAASGKLVAPVAGGASRQASVLAGLDALAGQNVDRVLVHDAARPLVSAATIDGVLAALETHPAALAAVPLADTLKRAGEGNLVAATIERAGLWRAQTPQGFRYPELLAAHRRAAMESAAEFTDDAAIAEWAGLVVALVPDSNANSKITTAEDLAMAQSAVAALEPRTGTGFDVHRFAEGDNVWLCGVKIPHSHRLDGHSDADVGLHALTDAILGALGDGDIGQHFPPTDEKWRGAASHLFLADARERVAARGARITNVDVTLLCEAPKVGPHRPEMQRAIAEILKIDVSRVGVKATTTEQLGFTGRREGIAAMASATLLVPA